MEVWSQIAVFIPFSQRINAFHALRQVGMIPETFTNIPNAFMQFCSEADQIERAYVPTYEGQLKQLLHMGFSEKKSRNALDLSGGSVEMAIYIIIYEVESPTLI